LDPPLAAPRAQARVLGANPSFVGQMVHLEVELLRDDRAQAKPAPFFPEIRVRDAIALLSKSAPPPEQRVIEGIPFLVQKRRYLLFAQVPGTITLPAISIELGDTSDHPISVTTQPLTLHADAPRGAGSQVPLIARNVQLHRKLDGNLASLAVGDAFSVTLELTATDTDPVVLPQLSLSDIPGLSRYPAESTTTAHADRGEYQASRTVSATYVAREFGFYHLPRVSVLWLDPSTGQYAHALVPPLSFRARVNPHLGTGCMGGPQSMARWGGALFAGLLLCALGLRSFRRFSARRAARAQVKRTAQETAVFDQLRQAAHAGDDRATLSALYRWLLVAGPRSVTLHGWLAQVSDDALRTTTTQLEQRVTSGTGSGHAADVLAPLDRYRKSHRPAHSAAQRLLLNS